MLPLPGKNLELEDLVPPTSVGREWVLLRSTPWSSVPRNKDASVTRVGAGVGPQARAPERQEVLRSALFPGQVLSRAPDGDWTVSSGM